MPIFIYSVITSNGILIQGEEEAESIQELERILSGKSLFIRKVRKKYSAKIFFNRDRIVSVEALLIFNQEFIALLRAGLMIPEAISILANRPGQPVLTHVLLRVLDDIRQGKALSESCSKQSRVFDELYLFALRTGEKSGDMVMVLEHYQKDLKRKMVLQTKISQAMIYPMFLLITLIFVLGILFVFVMPRFVAMYTDFGEALPFATRVLLDIVENTSSYGLIAFLMVFGVLSSYRLWRKSYTGRLLTDRIKEKLPLLGDLNKILTIARVSRTLSTLLATGVPLVEAMTTVKNTLSNRAYAWRLEQATNEVTQGKSFSESANKWCLLPTTAVKMVEVGEATGKLDMIFVEMAKFYEEDIEHRLVRIMTLIEPILMLFIGILVGGVIIAMYLPIFSMADIIR